MMKNNINQYTVHRLSNDPKNRFIDKSVKIFVIIFHMCKKVLKGINVEALIKTQTPSDEKYDIWNKNTLGEINSRTVEKLTSSNII